jgi:hypothetical protein
VLDAVVPGVDSGAAGLAAARTTARLFRVVIFGDEKLTRAGIGV